MRYQLQIGRTMLETISVMAIIGVLSVTGVYMYRQAMNSVKADAILKDVLVRAGQTKGNLDMERSGGKKLVYTPEYKKRDNKGEEIATTKGRYGYTFEIDSSSKSSLVIIRVKGSITSAVCDSLKSKFNTYKKGTFLKVIAKDTGTVTKDTNILNDPCPEEISSLKFYVGFE